MEIYRTDKKQVKQYEPTDVAISLTDKDLENENIIEKIDKTQFDTYKMCQAEWYKSGVITKQEFLESLKEYKTRQKEIQKYLKLK